MALKVDIVKDYTQSDSGANPGVGVYAVANFTPVAEAYGAGDIISTAQEFAWKFAQTDEPVPHGSLIRILSSMMKTGVTSVPAGMTSHSLKNYTAAPATASQGNNDVWAAQSADLAIYRGSISLGTLVDEGAFLFVEAQGIDKDIRLAEDSSSHYGTLVSAGAHTATAVAREVTLRGMLL